MSHSPAESASNARTLSVAVIGCGRIGTLLARQLHELPQVRLAGVCDIDRIAAERVARLVTAPAFVDYGRLLDTVAADVVVVSTPESSHYQPALQALQTGSHVFCEKPLATTVAEARELVRAARDRNVSLAVDYNRRFGFGYAWAAELLEIGEIGPPRQMLVHVTDGWPNPAVIQRPEAMLTTLLTHHIDLVRWLVGEIEEVQARFGPANEHGLFTEMLLSFACQGGGTASITGACRAGQSRTHELAILGGTEGEIRVHDVCRRLEVWTGDPDCQAVSTPDLFGKGDAFEATHGAHLADFLKRCAAGEPPAISGDDGLRGLQIAEAAVESNRTGTRVCVPVDSADTGLGI